MADEKRTSLDFSVVKDGQTAQMQTSLTEDLTGDLFGTLSQSVPTSWAAISLGSVTIPDLLFVRNGDVSNFIQLATADDDSGIFAKLSPGRCAFLPPDPSATIYGRADTAPCVLQALITEA